MKHLWICFLCLVGYDLFSQSCNYIEYGDFENAKFEDEYTLSPHNGTPNDSIWRFHTLDTNEINSIDLYKVAPNNVITYIRDTRAIPTPITFGTCVFNTTLLNRPPFGGNIFVGLTSMKNSGGPNYPDNRESIALKLKYPLKIGDSFQFSFHARKNQPVCSNFWVYIYGSKDRPCDRPTVTRIDGTVSGCGYRATLIDSVLVNTAVWTRYSFRYTAQDSFKYFITRMQEYNWTDNDPNIRYGFFDDFRLENLGIKYKLRVTTNIDTFHLCRHQMAHRWDTLKFTVRLDTHTARNLIPINAAIHIPAAYDNVDTPLSKSPITIQNLVIPANTISKTDSMVFLVFPYNNTQAVIHGQYADIRFVASGQDYCLQDDVKIPTKVFKGDANMTAKIHEFTSNICSDTITYCASISGGNKPYTYLWSGVSGVGTDKRDSSCWTNAQVLPRMNTWVRIQDSNHCRIKIYKQKDRFGQYALNDIPSFPTLYGELDSINEHRILDVFGSFPLNSNIVFKDCHFRMRGYYSVLDNIRVQNSAKFYNCTFTSCREAAWEGIQLGTPTSNKVPELIMSGCTIEDAQRAISITNGSAATKFHLGLERNQFLNNHYGIEFKPMNVLIPTIDVVNLIPFQGNKFDLTRSRLKEYDINNPNTVSPYPKTMIRLEDVNYFSLGTHGKGRNEIYRCENGIELERTNADVKNFYITHFSTTNSMFNSTAWIREGKGIWAHMGARTKFFTPPGKTVNIQAKSTSKNHQWPDIWMGDYGVDAYNIVLNLSNTSFNNHTTQSILAQSAWSLCPIKINDNYLDEWYTEQEPMRVCAYYTAEIARDTIIATPWDGKNAVSVHGYNLNNMDSVNVQNNYLRTSNFPYYIHRSAFMLEAFNHSKKLNIFQNQFEMLGSNEEWDGAIGLVNSNNIHAYQNRIIGQGATKVNSTENNANFGAIQNPLGIYAKGSTSVISCNQIRDFNTGIRYTGTNLSSTLSVNTLTDHDHGLMVDNGTSINPQLHQGNQWTGSLTWGAYNGNPWIVLPTQKFTVHTSNAFPGNPLWPSENSFNRWFDFDVNANDKTQCDLPPVAASSNPVKAKISVSNFSGIATVWERDLMLGGSLFSNYNQSLVFQNQLQLFGVMQDRSTLILPNSPEAEWLNANQTTPLGQFYRLERAIDSALTPDPDYLRHLEQLLDERATQMQSISTLDSLKGEDSLGTQRIYYLSQEDAHRAQLRQIDQSIEQLEQPRIAAIYGRLEQFIAMTDAVETTAPYMDYLKQMYSLQLRYLRYSGLDSPAWDTVRQIADLCPFVNEKAVYMARSMMMGQGDTAIYYNDRHRCIEVGGYKQAGTRRDKKGYSLYPNPASQKVTLRFPNLSDENLDIQIFDIMGRLVLNEKIKQSKLTHDINTSILNNNLYIVKVLSNKQELYNEKLYIIQ